MILQKGQGVLLFLFLPEENIQLPVSGHTCLRRQLFQISQGLFRQCEQFLLSPSLIGILSPSHVKNHNHFLTLHHQLLNQAILNRCKAGKAVQHYHTVFYQFGAMQRLP